jgi:hypothetical protein
MSAQTGPIEFNQALEEIPVSLSRPGVATPWECVLREMDGFKRDSYLNSQRNKVERDSRNLKDFADVQTSLIAQCLFDSNTQEAVPAKDIRGFPSKVQMKLYTLCMELCGFDTKAEEEAKNS